MLKKLMEKLGERNGFIVDWMTQENTAFYLSTFDQKRIAESVSRTSFASAYVQHIFYTNFTEFDLPKPIYINMVRDPIERVISWYYYVRTLW